MKYTDGKVNTLTGEYEFKSSIQREDGKYVYVWGDEFDGNTLDDSKWDLTSAISAESSFKLSRDPKALKVQDGLLKLSAQRFFDPDNNQIQAIAPYTIDSKSDMNFQYGYLEMRARIPLKDGAWPALWMSGACKTGAVVSDMFTNGDITASNFSAEVDIIEYVTFQPNLHKWFYEEVTAEGVVNKHSSLGAVETPVKHYLYLDPANSYNYQIIGYEWTPEKMTIYVNGEVFYTYNWTKSVQLDGLNDMSDFLNPMFIRINNHLLPKNIPSDYSTLPAEFYVDYVRLYQKENTGGLWLSK
jgi:beta-glucanase (GH16 family)